MEFVSAKGGPKPPVPCAFGQYEVGRTSKPWVHNEPSPWALDRTTKQLPLETTGDPGQYDPYAYGFMSDEVRIKGYNKLRPPFDSTEIRDFGYDTFLGGDSGNLTYNAGAAQKKLEPTVDANVSVFRSKSAQRPSSRSEVPGPTHYSPDIGATHRHLTNSGANLRSANARFGSYHPGLPGQKRATSARVGPSTYRPQNDRSLEADTRAAMARSSRIHPGA